MPQRTKDLNKVAKRGARATSLRRIIGKPIGEQYLKSCNFNGDDGLWEYRHFYVNTARPSEVGKKYKNIDEAVKDEDAGKKTRSFERIIAIVPK